MRRLLFACLALAGCYSPSPPDGAYLCATGDQACPSGQHCTCGQCVKNDSAAACSFSISTGVDRLSVDEHEQFPLTLQALDQHGNPATGFAGTVTLTALSGNTPWGDVLPAQVTFSGGTLTPPPMVSLNRETLSPAFAVIKASFAGASGTSGGIDVTVPAFTVDATEIAPPLLPFGWATDLAAEPNVTKQGSLYTMYFVGQGSGKAGIGMATSTDGKTFAPEASPALLQPPGATVFSPTAFTGSLGAMLAASIGIPQVPGFISLATSSDGGKSFTSYVNGMPVLDAMSCSYCGNGLSFPQVLPDPSQTTPDGGTQPLVMFFSSISITSSSINVSIDRADSPDGVLWTAEPAPLLSSSLSGEQILLSPRVLLDGSVWKMWYSYAAFSDLQTSCSALLPCPTGSTCVNNSCVPNDAGDAFFALCQQSTSVQVGYATSADGRFWTKSTTNPALSLDKVSGSPRAILVGSVVPTQEGKIALWFSTFRKSLVNANRCVPNGIRRAVRP
jgi:hypothetical protein